MLPQTSPDAIDARLENMNCLWPGHVACQLPHHAAVSQ